MTEIVRKLRYSKYYLLAIAFLIAIFAMFFYMEALTQNIEARSQAVLRDTTKHLYSSFTEKAEDEWNILTPLAYFAAKEEDFLHSEDLRKRMLDLQESSGYDYVFAADMRGNTLTSYNERLYVGDRAYFRTAMRGENVLSDVIEGRVSHKSVLCAAVPIRKEEKVVGIVSAAIVIPEFEAITKASIFDGAGDVYITTKTGDLIVGNDKESEFFLGDNLFVSFLKEANRKQINEEQIINDFHSDKEGFFPYTDQGEKYYAYYAPLGMNDWFVICTVPAAVIDKQTDSLQKMLWFLTVGLLLSFALILVFVGLSGKESREILRERNHELEINERRFRMASSLYNNVVIEWNIEERELIFLSGYENIAAEPILKNYPQSAVEKGLVHPDSAEAFLKMHEGLSTADNVLCGEFKLLLRGNSFVWCRIDELLLFDEDGKPVRAIGRITDINKEREEIELLKSKAKLDSGTGLYNKEATRLLAEDCLKQDPASKHALLIIDLDDFKEINDSRGHVEGDRILLNAANIMKELFRSSDIIGRIGGDEFMVLVRSVGDELFLESKIRRLCERVREHDDITLSVGIAQYPSDGKDYITLYRCADNAMYEAKARGKGTFAFYNS